MSLFSVERCEEIGLEYEANGNLFNALAFYKEGLIASIGAKKIFFEEKVKKLEREYGTSKT